MLPINSCCFCCLIYFLWILLVADSVMPVEPWSMFLETPKNFRAYNVFCVLLFSTYLKSKGVSRNEILWQICPFVHQSQ